MKKFISALIVVALVVGGVMIIKKKNLEDSKEKTAKIYPLNVDVVYLKEGNVTLTLPYIAQVKSDENVIITSKFAGKILYIKPLGEKVKKGEVILRVDNSALKAKLSEVDSNINSLKSLISADKIALDTLKTTHIRTKKLLEVKMASIEQFESEKSKIATLEAKIIGEENKLNALYSLKQSILNDLSYTDIKSPINGVVSNKFLNINETIFPGKPALKISSNEKNYLFLNTNESIKGVLYKGIFYEAKALNSTLNGLKTYKIDVNDPNLVSGEKVNVDVVMFRGKATLIPFDAILRIDGKDYIFEVKDNKVDIKQITVISSGKEGVVCKEKITSPLIKAAPDILLKIKAGYPVNVRNSDV